MTFGSRLSHAMQDRGRFCAGIDPHPELLDAWGLTDSVNGLEKFAMTAVEAFAGTVGVVKPQSAFFERHGSRGIAVLERVIAGCRERGCLVLLDVKRGDIGSTAQAYADAYLDRNSPLYVDAITVSPYLGVGSLDPIFETALANDSGVFVLALTSNPEGAQVQHALTTDGRSLAGLVLDAVATRNAGVEELGSIGAVVGRDGRAAVRPRRREPRRQRPAARAGHRRAGRHPGRRTPRLRRRRPQRPPDELAGAARRRARQGRAARGRPPRSRHLPGPRTRTPSVGGGAVAV